jgi:hypothetical protein
MWNQFFLGRFSVHQDRLSRNGRENDALWQNVFLNILVFISMHEPN